MARQSGNVYFEVFVQLIEFSCRAAIKLNESLLSFDEEDLPALIEELHEIEHTADIEKHRFMNRLAKEFVTPIEREDLIQMGHEIDDVTDSIEDVMMRIYMYHITSIRPMAIEFSQLIVRCCDALKAAMQEFHNFKKSKTLHELIVEINRLEEEGDRLYVKAVRELYMSQLPPVEILAWTEMFEALEKCCDACEHVSNVMESVIMKNM